jgi:hypothetical protein
VGVVDELSGSLVEICGGLVIASCAAHPCASLSVPLPPAG